MLSNFGRQFLWWTCYWFRATLRTVRAQLLTHSLVGPFCNLVFTTHKPLDVRHCVAYCHDSHAAHVRRTGHMTVTSCKVRLRRSTFDFRV